MGLNKRLFWPVYLVLLLVLVLTGTGIKVAQADPGWYDAAWAYRKKITIDSTKVSATLADFPVLINLTSDGDLASHAQDDGDDILFTASDGVSKLNHEIEKFVDSTGELVAWVKVPSLSSSVDTDIYMYYGHSGAGNQQNATFVWDSNYKMVQHLQETTGGTNAIKDSTSNTNHGTDNNTPTLGAAGKIDGAIGFDGTDDYVHHGDKADLEFGAGVDFTIEAWIKTSDTGVRKGIVGKRSAAGTWVGYEVEITDGNIIRGRMRKTGGADVDTVSSSTVTDGSWHHIVFVADRDGNGQIYIDGSANGNPVDISGQNGDLSNSDSFWIARDDAAGYFNGTLDEVRISDTLRSSDWISTSYNNQSAPSGFYGVESEGAGAPAVVGGIVYPVDKVRVLVPWLLLFLVLPLTITTRAFYLRKSV